MIDFASRITKGVQPAAIRSVIYGVEGVGKSTLASMFPNPITLGAENGTGHLDTTRFVPSNFEEAIELYSYLYSDPTHGYETLNVDTLGWLESMAATSLCEEYQSDSLENLDGGYGKWKRFLVEKMDLSLQWLSALHGQGMHINVIGHVDIKKHKDPAGTDYDRYVLSTLADKSGERIKQWADNVLFMNYDTMTSEDKKGFGTTKAKSFGRRVVHAKRSAAYDAKTRMGLPESFDFEEPPEQGFQTLWSYFEAWNDRALPSPTESA